MINHLNPAPRIPERVVLIGARGFIGATLRRHLEARTISNLGLTSSDVDLCVPSAPDKLAGLIKPGDSVVMLAALTPDKGRDLATMMKNLAMMQAVCAAAGKVGCA